LFSPILEGSGSDGFVRALHLLLVASPASPVEVSRGPFRIFDVLRSVGEGEFQNSYTDLWTLASALPEVSRGRFRIPGCDVSRPRGEGEFEIPKPTSGHLRPRSPRWAVVDLGLSGLARVREEAERSLDLVFSRALGGIDSSGRRFGSCFFCCFGASVFVPGAFVYAVACTLNQNGYLTRLCLGGSFFG